MNLLRRLRNLAMLFGRRKRVAKNISPADLDHGPCRLKVRFVEQGPKNWCWAACAAMVLQAYKVPNSKPCNVASKTIPGRGKDYCCRSTNEAECNKTLGDSEITKLWESLKINAKPEPGQVSSEVLADEISKHHRPVQIGSGFNHVSIVYGYFNKGNRLFFQVHDPTGKRSRIVCEADLQGTAEAVIWDATWINLNKPPQGVQIECEAPGPSPFIQIADRISPTRDRQLQEHPSTDLTYKTIEESLSEEDLREIEIQAAELMAYFFAGEGSNNAKTMRLELSLPIWRIESAAVLSEPVQTKYRYHQIFIDEELRAYAISHRDDAGKQITCELSIGRGLGPILAVEIANAMADLKNKGIDSHYSRLLNFPPSGVQTLWLVPNNKVYVLSDPADLLPPELGKLFDMGQFLNFFH